MATNASVTPAAPSNPYTQGHKRSKTAILKAIVSPHKGHKKSASVSQDDGSSSNPLNSYMFNPNVPPQLPPIDTSAPLLPPLDLEPPLAPFAREERKKRLHKKSLSSISLSSIMSRRDDSPPSVPSSPSRGSFDISGALRDLMSQNRGNVDTPPSPQKPSHSKKPSKSKSAIDISLLRRGHDKKETKPFVKDNKENRQPYREPLTPLSPRSIHGLFTRDPVHMDTRAEELFAPPKIYSGASRPRLTPNGSDSSINIVTRPRTSISSEGRPKSSRRRETEELMKRYTPTEYTPASQKSFFGNHEPALLKPSERDSRRDRSKSREPKARPKSEFIPSSTSNQTGFSIATPRQSYESRRPDVRNLPDPPKEAKASPAGSYSSSKKGSKRATAGLDLAGIDTAFEALLVSA
jgi:hypothetical protein